MSNKTFSEFAEFAKTSLAESFSELEKARKKILGQTIIFISCAVMGGILTAALYFLVSSLCGIISGGIMIIPLIGYYVVQIHEPYKGYKSDYKRNVVGKMVKFIDPTLDYDQSKGIPQSKYMLSKLFLKSPDRYDSEDYVFGKMGLTEIEFSEVHSEYKTQSTDSKGHTRTHWHTIFRGIFLIADFNKDFRGETVVLPDFAEKAFGFIGKMLQSWNPSRENLIKLEDPDFEKLFVVYGTDQVEARYILSPSFMDRILNFHTKAEKLCGGNVCISFVRSKMFIAIPCGKNLFEPVLFEKVSESGYLLEYFAFLNLAAGIVGELNLNTRIWSKDAISTNPEPY
jgi:hypothetical protein